MSSIISIILEAAVGVYVIEKLQKTKAMKKVVNFLGKIYLPIRQGFENIINVCLHFELFGFNIGLFQLVISSDMFLLSILQLSRAKYAIVENKAVADDMWLKSLFSFFKEKDRTWEVDLLFRQILEGQDKVDEDEGVSSTTE